MAAHQAPPSLGFSRQEHWSGLPFPSPMHESEKWSRSVAQSCPTLSDPMDCSLPGSSIHGIFQARVLEWGAIAFSVYCLYYRIFFFHKRNFQNYKSICMYQSSLTPKASEKWYSVCSFHYFWFLMMETYNEMCREWFLCWSWLVSLFLACFQSQTTLYLLLGSCQPFNMHTSCLSKGFLSFF